MVTGLRGLALTGGRGRVVHANSGARSAPSCGARWAARSQDERRRSLGHVVRRAMDKDDLPDEGSQGTDSVESMFARELQKRSLSSDSYDEDNYAGGQLEKSRAMQSEGLEGLPGRAKDLLTLGSTFFLSFLPLGAVVAVIFGTLAFGFGDAFVHTGGAGPPPYVDPNDLLSPDQAPGAPFVKLRRNYTNYETLPGGAEDEDEDAAAPAAAEGAIAASPESAEVAVSDVSQ